MKTKKLSVSEETKKAISYYLQQSAYLKNAYFWHSPSGANQRRSYESRNSFEYQGDNIELKIEVNCSCKNIYVYRTVIIDGKNTNATALKKFLR